MLPRLLLLLTTLLALASVPSAAPGDVDVRRPEALEACASGRALAPSAPATRFAAPFEHWSGVRTDLGDACPTEAEGGEADDAPSRADDGVDRLHVDPAPPDAPTDARLGAAHGHRRPAVRPDAPRGPPSPR